MRNCHARVHVFGTVSLIVLSVFFINILAIPVFITKGMAAEGAGAAGAAAGAGTAAGVTTGTIAAGVAVAAAAGGDGRHVDRLLLGRGPPHAHQRSALLAAPPRSVVLLSQWLGMACGDSFGGWNRRFLALKGVIQWLRRVGALSVLRLVQMQLQMRPHACGRMAD